MLSTIDLLDLARAHQGGVSDYRVAQLLGIKPQHISTYRHTATKPSNPVAMRLAELCDLDPAEVITWVNLERSTTPADREVWEMMLERVTPKKPIRRTPSRAPKADILSKA
jgi:plasmid maintenance system antidote protein VapI